MTFAFEYVSIIITPHQPTVYTKPLKNHDNIVSKRNDLSIQLTTQQKIQRRLLRGSFAWIE